MSAEALLAGFGRGPGVKRLRERIGGGGSIVDEPPLLLSAGGSGSRGGTSSTLCVVYGDPSGGDRLTAGQGRPAGTQPAELLAAAFDQRGEEAFGLLGAGFLALLWERERRRLLVVADPMGTGSAFFHVSGPDVLIAGEVAPLLALLPSRPPVDDLSMALWLSRSSPRAGATLLSGVRRVPGGHVLRVEAGGASLERWWSPRYRAPSIHERPAAVRVLREAMDGAVTRAAAGTANPGLMLSGGFDSAALAARFTAVRPGARLRSYSRVFPDHPEADESARIDAILATLGIEGAVVPFAGGSALGEVARFVDAWGLPPASPNLFIWRGLLQRAAREGVDVMLDGEGGDEVFGCSPALLADHLRRGRGLHLLRLARRLPGMTGAPESRWIRRAISEYGLRHAVPPGLHTFARRARGEAGRAKPWLSAAARARLVAEESPYGWKRLPGPRWWASLVDGLVIAPDAFGAFDQLRRDARLVGLRFSHPWRDMTLIERVLDLSPDLAFDPDRDRPIAREAVADRLPPGLLAGTDKAYFNDPLTDAISGPDAALATSLVLEPPDELVPFLDPGGVEALLRGPSGRAWALDVWRLAAASIWLRSLAEPETLAELVDGNAEDGFNPRSKSL